MRGRHPEVAVCCNSSDPGSKGFCGLLRELLGLVETNRVDGWMEDRHRQGLDLGHHLFFGDQGVLPSLIEGQPLEIKWHHEPELAEEMAAMDSSGVFVILPLILEETKLVLRHVELGDGSWVLVLLCGVPVALRTEVRHVESHLLQTIVVRVRDVCTAGDDARKGCMNWGLLLDEWWPAEPSGTSRPSFSSVPSRPFSGWSLGGQLYPIGLLDARLLLLSDARLRLFVVRHCREVLSQLL